MRAAMLAAGVAVLVCAAPASAQVSTGDSPTSGGISQPVASTPPSVSGTEQDGNTLTGDDGEWGALVTTEHIWLRCSAGGTGCSQVSSANTYDLTAPDVGKRLKFRVRATGALGFTETDVVTSVIAAIPTANDSSPQISGIARQGEILTAINGTWKGTQPLSFAHTWKRCDPTCTGGPVVGSTSSYAPAAADVGHQLQLTVTASGPGGSDSASVTSGVVAPRPATGGGGSGGGTTGGGTGTGTSPGTGTTGAATLRKLSPFPVIAIGGRILGRRVIVSRLRVYRAPRGAIVTVRCKGRSCPFRRQRRRVKRRSGLRLRALERSLRSGTVIVIIVRKGKTIGKYTRLRIRRGAAPARVDRCIRPGARRPIRCPS